VRAHRMFLRDLRNTPGHVQSRLLKDERHSGEAAKCGIASVAAWGSCVCAEWELCGASEVALKTFETMEKTIVRSERSWQTYRRSNSCHLIVEE
jgi:hypothetical protein